MTPEEWALENLWSWFWAKKFKLEVWEVIVQKMALNEVAVFTVNKDLVLQYPFVSKTLRDVNVPREERRSHCCAMTIQTEGVGYNDLNDILKDPSDLEFTIELLKVEQPEDYEKESWQMNEDEKLKLVPQLKELGNEEFKKRNYQTASDHYAKAIGIIEQLMIKEKPHETEWDELDKMKVPLLLNFAQCKLSLGDFYPVIEHCTTVIKTDPDSVKAYFRRAKAHVGAWNTKEAFEDFRKVIELDPSLTTAVTKEMAALEELIKKKDSEDKQKLKNLFN
jgi:AH receptor-interacting protein